MNDEIYLRPLTVDDAAVSWRWRNDPSIWKYTGSRPDCVVTEEMEREWAAKVISDSSRMNFAICRKSDSRYVGNVYIVNIQDASGELGIFIGDSTARGQGYAQQALRLLKNEAMACGISRLVIDVDKDNISALVAYLKVGARLLGMKEDGRIVMLWRFCTRRDERMDCLAQRLEGIHRWSHV